MKFSVHGWLKNVLDNENEAGLVIFFYFYFLYSKLEIIKLKLFKNMNFFLNVIYFNKNKSFLFS